MPHTPTHSFNPFYAFEMTTPSEPNSHKRKLAELTPAQVMEAKLAANAAFQKLSSAVSSVYWKPMKDAYKMKAPVPSGISPAMAAYLRPLYEDFTHKEAIFKGTAQEALPPVFCPPPVPKVQRPVALEVTSYDYTDLSKDTVYCTYRRVELDGRDVVFCREPWCAPDTQYVSAADIQPKELQLNMEARCAHCSLYVTPDGKVRIRGGMYPAAPGVAMDAPRKPIPYWVDGVRLHGARQLALGQTVEFRGRLVNPANPSEVIKRDLVVMSFKAV